ILVTAYSSKFLAAFGSMKASRSIFFFERLISAGVLGCPADGARSRAPFRQGSGLVLDAVGSIERFDCRSFGARPGGEERNDPLLLLIVELLGVLACDFLSRLAYDFLGGLAGDFLGGLAGDPLDPPRLGVLGAVNDLADAELLGDVDSEPEQVAVWLVRRQLEDRVVVQTHLGEVGTDHCRPTGRREVHRRGPAPGLGLNRVGRRV